jgi:glycosyltransferase involved in cell wall biosynthesis
VKILMSAFSCGPGRGSEPGVGWNMALEAARLGHEVTVLTQTEFQAQIEQEVAAGRVPANLKFDIFMPRWLERVRDAGLKRGLSSAVWQPVSLVWQFCALAHARRTYGPAAFDLVHHVSMAQIRHPTRLGRLGPPLVLGPLGGGDRAPRRLRRSFPWKPWLQELVRDIYNVALRFDPITRAAFRDAAVILLRTRAALAAVPPRYRRKALVRPGIGIGETVEGDTPRRDPGGPLRLIYAGHLWYLKGVHLAIRALARAHLNGVDATLSIVGDGPDRDDFIRLADCLGVLPSVDWHGQLPRHELMKLYGGHHAFLFCSLRDAAPTVIVEAFAHGLPVICFDIGGPGEMVDGMCGRVVATAGRSEAQCVGDVAAAIGEIAADEGLRLALGRGAKARYRGSSWASVVAGLYAEVVPRSHTACSPTALRFPPRRAGAEWRKSPRGWS